MGKGCGMYHIVYYEFRYSCQWMESFTIPCTHISYVLVYLGFDRLPNCLIVKRWTMKVKEGIVVPNVENCLFGDSCYISLVSMKDKTGDLINVACRTLKITLQ